MDHGPRTTNQPFVIRGAFSLIEILVTVALLSFIVLGLFAMFDQTKRAFTSSMTQTDVLEAGRAVTDMLARELEQVTPSRAPATSFYARINNNLAPLTQNLPGTASPATTRTNYLEDIFILTRQNQNWVGIGYCVRLSDPTGALWPAQIDSTHAGVGSLYRFSETMPVLSPGPSVVGPGGRAYPALGLSTDANWLWSDFTNACFAANSGAVGSRAISNRICDGVVHFHIRAFATNSFPIFSSGVGTNAFFLLRTNGPNFGYGLLHPACTHPNLSCPDRLDLIYTRSNAVPAYLEFEMGLLEARTLARYDSIAAPAARLSYFQRDDNSTRVHLFRQRVPVRNVDPAAFQ